MNIIVMQLIAFVRNSLNPQKFIGQKLSPEDFYKWRNYIVKEADSLKILISVTSLSDYEIEKLITQIVDLSNTINSYIFRQFKLIRSHAQAKNINEYYNFTLHQLDSIILTFHVQFPGPSGKVKISDSNLYVILNGLKKDFYKLSQNLQFSTVEKELINIVQMGLLKLMHKKRITRNDSNYISEIISTLLRNENLDNTKLAELLIIHDFNTSEFYSYCIKKWKINLEDIPGLHEQQEMLLLEKDRIFELENTSRLSMPNNKKRLFFELNNFLDEKSTTVKRMVKLRRRFIRDNQKSKGGSRFLINLPVPQFGLFLRMQIEKGLLAKENLGDLFKFFATHFYTPNAEYISADSLQKKSTDVEFATAQKLKGQLIGMLNWLNTNFNLSNYN
ncbi:hypothetical protein [Mucilaginibacter psychrotolerans]|uniref:Uncharacterized protein n=1 Tax=Mucilaginibacter psychrotolerans TaxID=1524096 RepID=A0A4Y8SF51_9SPHI|nr:hypothetical protein [Mucilaginibacter psychrotolerans]TFF37016.1 hypothetical protein E2R66_13090 [Mucilaginibacter psychrotolerans]